MSSTIGVENISHTNGTVAATVDSSGNLSVTNDLTVDTSTFKVDSTNNRVGIGTTSPSQALHVAGGNPVAVVESTTSSGAFIKFENTSSTNTNRVGYAVHDFVVDTNGSERMRIDSSGNVLIGDTTVDKSGMTSGSGLTFNDSGQIITAVTSSNAHYINKTNYTSGTYNNMVFLIDGNTKGTISCNGTSTSYNTTSDHRLKENVVEMTDATTRLKQLQPKRFNFIADADTTVDGFIAHEVQSVVPEAITGTHNEVDDDGNPVYQGIDQSKLVPLLVKTIQELEARIVALENG